MGISAAIFYMLSAFILGSALLAVTARKIFRSAIWLLFTLIGIGGFYFWLAVEFIAAVQVVIYVGGIVVLIIFSIFLTQQSGKEMPKPIRSRAIFSALGVGFVFLLTWHFIKQYVFNPVSSSALDASVGNIGSRMLAMGVQGYALPFEVVSVLLLAAMVGCIVIAMRSPSPVSPDAKSKKLLDEPTQEK